jgi:hypothetical protein
MVEARWYEKSSRFLTAIRVSAKSARPSVPFYHGCVTYEFEGPSSMKENAQKEAFIVAK